jgi:hypothetical protein
MCIPERVVVYLPRFDLTISTAGATTNMGIQKNTSLLLHDASGKKIYFIHIRSLDKGT